MKLNSALSGVLAVSVFLISGCATIRGINTVTKVKEITPGIFKKKPAMLQQEFVSLQKRSKAGDIITREEVVARGFDFEAENIPCLRGPEAMKHIIGTENNRPALSTDEEIERYARAVNAYESCLVVSSKIVSKSDRFYFNKKRGKTSGTEKVYVFTFKNNLLFDARIASQVVRNESETEKAIGGNVADGLIGGGISLGKSFR